MDLLEDSLLVKNIDPKTFDTFPTRRNSLIKGGFIKGPIPLKWITSAFCLGGKAPNIAMAIMYKFGMCPKDSIAVTSALLRQFGCFNRQTAYRALNCLQKEQLIEIQRGKGRCPRVKVVNHIFKGEEENHAQREK